MILFTIHRRLEQAERSSGSKWPQNTELPELRFACFGLPKIPSSPPQ